MQSLGLSDSTPRSESRLKALFWPSVESASDVDYLGAQGYWVCTLVAGFSFVVLAATGHPVRGAIMLLLYYLGGVGIREHSRYAAAVVLLFYVVDALLPSPGVLSVIFTGLLLSNLRATWIASRWQPGSEEAAAPPRLDTTWSDKFVDRFPSWLWPKARPLFYVFSICLAVVYVAVLVTTMVRAAQASGP